MGELVPEMRDELPDESRRRGREAAVQMLYQWEIGRAGLEDVLDTFWSIEAVGERPAGTRAQEFAARLVKGTVADLPRIDALIAGATENWRLPRMETVDRAIIRLGAHEILAGETPPIVAIDEALDLARTFSTDEAVRFVNGVLDGIRRRLDEASTPAERGSVVVDTERH